MCAPTVRPAMDALRVLMEARLHQDDLLAALAEIEAAQDIVRKI